MAKVARKEKELMDHLESVFSRYAYTKEAQTPDLCGKSELRILDLIGRLGPRTMTEVSEAVRLSTSAVTSIMDALVEKDLVKRERCEDDRRVVRVELTGNGKKVFQQILEFHLRIVRGMLSSLDNTEQDTLIGLFRKMVERIETEKDSTS